jgi:FixJ family two-component response regulator
MATVLIVDDQPVNRQFLTTLLGYFDHDILEAGDGIEALETLRKGRVDLVITDVLMPTMDGYDFLQRMRGDSALAGTPLIFYTAAHYEHDARAMAEAHGVRHFLTKPAEPEMILAAVNSALQRQSLEVSSASLSKFNRHVMTAPADPIDPNAVVFVVDDDPAVRQFFTGIMSEESLKVETFARAEDFLENYEDNQTSCLVLEIRLPGMSGIALLEMLRSRRIDIPAIILTGHGNTAAAVDSMRLRVLDFLEKPADRRILLAKIYRALQLDSIKRRKQIQAETIRKRLAMLTARERDLVKLLIMGKTSKEIASKLQISVKTVSHHRAHLMAKIHASNLADLVRMTMDAEDK